MTGTNLYVNKCKQSRSYLNHLVSSVVKTALINKGQSLLHMDCERDCGC